MASSSSSAAGAASAPPQPPLPPAPKKAFFRRALPFLLVTNLAVGVYVLLRTSQKPSDKKDEEAVAEVSSAPSESKESVIKPSSVTPAPVKVLPPIPEDEQRKLLQWILEEKRKVKSTDPSEKKKIDEEKALLKQLIRAKSLPSL
ncbi:hypothetical protein J5N97_019327 [Dioscorea zingiberensis]|uniref:Uncharacterized protein n=1 Tax=Dioscorea zingiberensis TaxID=325984 RepID=A0A9D5CDX4_9LILI|nr:hypothetical protein J5N97_019327 [Dioscorea zingiberensis]